MLEAAPSLANLHTNGILQWDIKPDNVLVFFDETLGANQKVTDVGVELELHADDKLTFSKGVGAPFSQLSETTRGGPCLWKDRLQPVV